MQKTWKEVLSIGKITGKSIRDFLFILAGAALQAIALNLFLIPANLASGGVSGIAQMIHYGTGWPVGLMVFIGNIPLFIIGWRYLGGPPFALRTLAAVGLFSLITDITARFIPAQGITQDILLNSLYGGVISGVGFGLVYRGRGTSGGSDILARILNNYKGIPISQSYLMVDSLVMLSAGLVFGWDNALYALVNLYVSGQVADVVTTGVGVVRTVLIITKEPEKVSRIILEEMGRGLTRIQGEGGYTHQERTILYCVVTRAEVERLKVVVREVDDKAFLVVGQVLEALGEGFKPLSEE
ncbi:MAG: YitT family protein [Anaerolineales bacterium]|nr:YitT family protein [Anaerolineales bacterium]